MNRETPSRWESSVGNQGVPSLARQARSRKPGNPAISRQLPSRQCSVVSIADGTAGYRAVSRLSQVSTFYRFSKNPAPGPRAGSPTTRNPGTTIGGMLSPSLPYLNHAFRPRPRPAKRRLTFAPAGIRRCKYLKCPNLPLNAPYGTHIFAPAAPRNSAPLPRLKPPQSPPPLIPCPNPL